MRHRRLRPLLSAAPVLLALAAAPAAGGDQDEARDALARGEVLPLARILDLAAREAPGDVLKVELERDDGLMVYEIKVLSANGRIREIELDARTGRILSVEGD